MTADARRDLAARWEAISTFRDDFAEVVMFRALLNVILDGWHLVAARPATGGSDGHGHMASYPDQDGDVVRYGTGG